MDKVALIRGASNHADRNIISIAFLWFDFHTSCEEMTGPQLFCIVYLSSTSPSSQTGGCFCTRAIAVTEILSAVNINTSTISDLIIISQLNHFTFVSALLFPILRLNLALPLQFQGLGTGGWLNLTRQDFPAIYNQLTKASRIFSARTIFQSYLHKSVESWFQC